MSTIETISHHDWKSKPSANCLRHLQFNPRSFSISIKRYVYSKRMNEICDVMSSCLTDEVVPQTEPTVTSSPPDHPSQSQGHLPPTIPFTFSTDLVYNSRKHFFRCTNLALYSPPTLLILVDRSTDSNSYSK